jgi:hypothetical protein
MSTKLDKTIKTGLDETRLLVLGAQVLLGFQFQSFFQDGFSELTQLSKLLCIAGLASIIMSVVLLIIPSMEHRLIERGRASSRLIAATNFYTGLGLVPLAVSLVLSCYVVISRHFGMIAGIASGLGLGMLTAITWFGFEYLIGLAPEKNPMPKSQTPLATKIDQLLTEARVIIPGAQALFGFQFVAMLTTGFDRLSHTSKVIHAIALGLIAINVVLLMTPAALHRLSYGGEESEEFLRIGSALVIAAPVFLAAGIAAETYVVAQKVFEDVSWCMTGALATFGGMIFLWYAVPLLATAKSRRAAIPL